MPVPQLLLLVFFALQYYGQSEMEHLLSSQPEEYQLKALNRPI